MTVTRRRPLTLLGVLVAMLALTLLPVGAAAPAPQDGVAFTLQQLTDFVALDYSYDPPLAWTYVRITLAGADCQPLVGRTVALRPADAQAGVTITPDEVTTDEQGTAYAQVRFDRRSGPPQIVASLPPPEGADASSGLEVSAVLASWPKPILARDLSAFDPVYLEARLKKYQEKVAATRAAAEKARMDYESAWWSCYEQRDQTSCRRTVAAREGPKVTTEQSLALQSAALTTASEIAKSMEVAGPLLQRAQTDAISLPGYQRGKLVDLPGVVAYITPNPASDTPGFCAAVAEALGLSVVHRESALVVAGVLQVEPIAPDGDPARPRPGDVAVRGALSALTPEGRGTPAIAVEFTVRGEQILAGGQAALIADALGAPPAQ